MQISDTGSTYIIIADQDHLRRIFTDGPNWPKDIEPTYLGYAIGKWIDEDGDGRYDVLEVETRGPFKDPRVYDFARLPLHYDNNSVFKERIYFDKTNPNTVHDEITVIDNALTRPWTSDEKYIRNSDPRPDWPKSIVLRTTPKSLLVRRTIFRARMVCSCPQRRIRRHPTFEFSRNSR